MDDRQRSHNLQLNRHNCMDDAYIVLFLPYDRNARAILYEYRLHLSERYQNRSYERNFPIPKR